MEPDTLRALERILVVLVGSLSIYLGYRLFLALPERADSTGKVVLPGNVSIYLSRVGPGIFLALFGAAVVALSLQTKVLYRQSPGASARGAEVPAEQRSTEYSGVKELQAPGNQHSLEVSRAMRKRDIAILSSVPGALRSDLPPEDRVDVELAIPRIKLGLMKSVWGEDWGDAEAFERWAMKGPGDPPPLGLTDAAEFYSGGFR
jgi:hypothetical protein